MTEQTGYRFNTFSGVFLPSILTILGVVMFLRLGAIVGEIGIFGTLGLLLFAESIAVSTGLSISSISTNTPVQSGGPYFLISRALGPGFGTSIGLTYYVSQTLSVPFYIIGFSEAVVTLYPDLATHQLWLCMVPLLVLFVIALIGANWAIRTQYIIITILGISIIAMMGGAWVAGPSVEQMKANLYAMPGRNMDIMVLAGCFAVFFPAVTGFLAGVNMSGDLADARKSIPKGTMLAITAGFIIYSFEIILFGSVWPQETLFSNAYGTLVKNALFHAGFLIFAGVAAATLSSALGTLLGAPRILQAFAADRIFSSLNLFAKGRGKNNDPVPAMILTLLISIATIYWGTFSKGDTLNAVAELVTMFTLCTYAIINISAAVEKYASNPSFRPNFRLFHWSIGVYGALACLTAALFINPLLLLIAFSVVGVLFLIAKKRTLAITFGDARRGYYFEHIRRYLLKLASMPQDPKNWRPRLLVLAGKDEKHKNLIRTGSLLNNERGILFVLRILKADSNAMLIQERQKELKNMKKEQEALQVDYFSETIAIPDEFDFDSTLNVFLQAHAAGPLALNIVLCGWPIHQERIKAFFQSLRTIRLLRMNSLVQLNPERMSFSPHGTIDIWWRGRKNGSLMLILAYLLSCNKTWQHCSIRLLRITEPNQTQDAKQELSELTESARIDAEHIVISDGSGFETAFRRESRAASVIFLGFVHPTENEAIAFHDKMSRLTEDMPTTFLVSSSGDTDLDS